MRKSKPQKAITLPIAQPHPAKRAIRDSRTPYWQIARWLKMSDCHLSRILNGHIEPSPGIDAQLRRLAAQIVASGAGRDGDSD